MKGCSTQSFQSWLVTYKNNEFQIDVLNKELGSGFNNQFIAKEYKVYTVSNKVQQPASSLWKTMVKYISS